MGFISWWSNNFSISFTLSNRREVDGELLSPINTQKVVYQLLMIRSNCTGGRMDRLAGDIKVLADMTRINGNDFVCGYIVSPLHPIGYGSPYERNSGLPDEILAQGCFRDPGGQVCRLRNGRS